MHVESITDEAALRRLVPEWDRLAESLAPWTPFKTSAWNLLHWRHFRRTTLLVRDDLRAFALRDEQGRLVAVAPMMLTSRLGVWPKLMRQLQFFGADPNVTELRGLVCAPQDEAAATMALLRHLHADRATWEWLRWSGIGMKDPSLVPILEMIGPTMTRTLPMYCVEPSGGWEAFRSALPRNTKEALRKCYNSLKRDGHAFTFEVVTRPDEAETALTRFFELHADRAAAKAGVPHHNIFAGRRAREFLRGYAREMAEQDRLRIFQLRIAGTVVATRVGFTGGGDLYLYYSGYLHEWGRYSVMTTTTAEAMKWAIERGIGRINLSVGKDLQKLRWRPRTWEFLETIQIAPTLRGQITLALFHLIERIRKVDVLTDASL